MLRRLSPSSLALVAGLAFSGSLHAQQSTTRGLNLGIHLTGASLDVDNGRSNAGGGGIFVGYGFNRHFELFGQLDGAEFDVNDTNVDGKWTMGHADLGLRFNFANSLRSWVPYVQGAFTARAVSVSDAVVNQTTQSNKVSFIGRAFTVGGGIVFYFNEKLGLDLQLAFSGGQFTKVDIGSATIDLPDPLDANSSRFNVGLSWWP